MPIGCSVFEHVASGFVKNHKTLARGRPQKPLVTVKLRGKKQACELAKTGSDAFPTSSQLCDPGKVTYLKSPSFLNIKQVMLINLPHKVIMTIK